MILLVLVNSYDEARQLKSHNSSLCNHCCPVVHVQLFAIIQSHFTGVGELPLWW